jgi:GTP-binding protein EngB required for normal cell division
MADHTADHVAGGPPPVDRSGEGGEFRAADSGGRAHDGFRYRVPLTPAARPVDGGFSSRGSPIVPVDSPSPAEEKRTDPDDPDNLAGWVGSLAEVKEGEMIAGRRTGPVPTVPPRPAVTPSWLSEDDEEEYQPTRGDLRQPMPTTTRAELISQLDALALLVELGRDYFAPQLIERARRLLTQAGARLRLSADHTVVALAGGTGSGKSSLFNALCGLELSRVGVTRPTTTAAHACVWGTEGADNLLDWLGVPPRYRHSRVSELDRGESDLTGLILLDLPDHDSVRAAQTAESDHLIRTADLLIWVLDPQKYADAAVHHRYLAEMSGHGAVMVAVLNQVDRVEPDDVEELLTDLRRLLEDESGVHPRILTTSAVTGEGLRELRQLLVETVADRRAAIERLAADLEQVVADFAAYGEAGGTAELPPPARSVLMDQMAEASGVEAVAEAVETAYQRRGGRAVGWPLPRWARRLRRDPLRVTQLDFLTEDTTQASTGPVGAQRAEIDTASAAAAEAAAGSLPDPWPKRVRAAARKHVETLPEELGSAIAATIPEEDAPFWWGAVRAVQYLLVALAGGSLVWLALLLVSWVGGGLVEPALLFLTAALTGGALLLGWLVGVGCRSLVEVEAARQREYVEMHGLEQVRRITLERVVAPLEEELRNYERFCQALEEAQPARRR